jgi:hypothetical protein
VTDPFGFIAFVLHLVENVEIGSVDSQAFPVAEIQLLVDLIDRQSFLRMDVSFLDNLCDIGAIELRRLDRTVIHRRNPHVGPEDPVRRQVARLTLLPM